MTLALASSATVAQSNDATPFADYRAAVTAFADAEASRQESAGTLTTVEDAIARMDESIARQEAEGERLAAIAPEPCYADAHAEFLAFWRYRIASYKDTLPLVEGAESVIGMIPMFLAADATIRAAHPAAYVEDTTSMTGFTSEPLNILDTLASCESPGPTASAIPSASAGASAASPSSGPIIHTWTGNEMVTLPGGPVLVSWSDEGCALTLKWESESGIDVEIVHTVDTEADSVTVDLSEGPGRLQVSTGCFTDAPAWRVQFSEP